MCLIIFAYHSHPEYPLIVTANRDEFHSRRTQQAHWWLDNPNLLAGKDLEADGTWLGVSRTGKFAAVTNIREPHLKSSAPASRGLLPRRYLTEATGEQQFARELQRTGKRYQGYNLIYGDSSNLYYFSNRNGKPKQLLPGIYGLSNAQLNTPWPKTTKAKELLLQQLNAQKLVSIKLLDVLTSTDIAEDALLPDTGVSLDWERRLSAICVKSSDYGTRSSTALVFDRQGQVTFHERTLAPTPSEDVKIEFRIQK